MRFEPLIPVLRELTWRDSRMERGLACAVLALQVACVWKCTRIVAAGGPVLGMPAAGWSWVPVVTGLGLLLFSLELLRRALERGTATSFLIGVAAFAFFAGVVSRKTLYRPEGDEPWYLLQADSLVQDHDLEVTPDEVDRRSPAFFGARLPAPTEQLAVVNGRSVVIHWPATALFLVPGEWLHSRLLSQLLLALLVAIALGSWVAPLTQLAGSETFAGIASLLVLFTSPLGQYGLLFFPDGIAAALWMLAFALGASGLERGSALRLLGAGAVAGAMVWLRPALGLPALACLAAIVQVRRTARRELTVPFLVGLTLMVAGFVAFQLGVDGQLSPQPFSFRPALVGPNLVRSLLDPGRGLLVHYPLWALAWVLVLLAAPSNRLVLTLMVAECLYLLVVAVVPETEGVGGWCPPGRFWVPVLPGVVVAAATALPPLGSRQRRAVAVALALFGLATNLVHDLLPGVAFSDGHHWTHRI